MPTTSAANALGPPTATISPMTHEEWITGVVTAIAALTGGIGGSFIVLWSAKWTNRSAEEIAAAGRRAQAELALEDRKAQAEFASQQRHLDAQQQREMRAKNAAAQLMEQIGVLVDMVPSLISSARIAIPRPDAIEARRGYQRSVATTVRLLTDPELVARCVHLQRLMDVVGATTVWPEKIEDRARADVQGYARYVLYSLVQFMHDEPLLAPTDPPVLKRNSYDGSSWIPAARTADYDDYWLDV